MNISNKMALVIAFIVVLVLFVLFGGGAMMQASLPGGMMGSGMIGGVSWMWIPTGLTLGFGLLLGWAILRQTK